MGMVDEIYITCLLSFRVKNCGHYIHLINLDVIIHALQVVN